MDKMVDGLSKKNRIQKNYFNKAPGWLGITSYIMVVPLVKVSLISYKALSI